MSNSAFRLHKDRAIEEVGISIDGREVRARVGDTVAGALFLEGQLFLRSSFQANSPRGYVCGMGVCWECSVTINGRDNVRACLTEVQPGMEILTSAGRADNAV